MNWQRYIAWPLSWLLAALTTGCGREAAKTNGKFDYKIAGIVFQEDQFFRLNELGMRAAARRYNVDLRMGNSFGTLDQEIGLVESYVAAGVDAIVISPLSVKGSVEALRQAHQRGIKVITYNGFIGASFPDTSIETDEVQLGAMTGKAAADYVKHKLGGKANIAMIEYLAQSPEEVKHYLAKLRQWSQ